MRQASFVRQLGERVDIAVSPELKAKELEKKMTYSNDCSGERPLIDATIRSSAEDDLGRAPVAHAFARSILELDASQGLVVAVMGPWGHGKSSFINLMREEFEGIPKESNPTPEESKTRRALTVIDFNPWMFSGSDQLVAFFFTQIGAELKVKNESRLGTIADWLGQYAGILKPAAKLIPLPGASAVGEAVAAGIIGLAGTTSADRSVQEVKDDITKALSKLEEPIVVVIDDIDRLTKIEIREIFKLVRLTASFPNIIYLLAFDRERVEQALSEDGISGRAYLEKIVLLSFDVPQASEKLLRSRAITELGRVLSPIKNATLDEDRWTSAYSEVIEPLLSNIRDVTRYAISAKQTIKDLGDKVDPVDLLAMEALRVFRPEIFQRLPKLRNELAAIHGTVGHKEKRTQKVIEKLLNSFPDDEVIQPLLKYVFPASQDDHRPESLSSSWRAAHRMAHIDFLNLYFDRVAPDELITFRDSERAFTCLNDRKALEDYLTELNSGKLEKVITDLIYLKASFTDDMIIPGTVTLLNLVDSIPKKKKQGVLDTGREFTVYPVVCELLRRVEHLEDEKEREGFVSQIFNDIETYSSRLFFIDDIIGYGKANENKIVSTVFAQQMRTKFIQKLQDTPPSTPSREWCAGRIYHAVQKETGKTPLRPSDDPALLQAVFYSLKSTGVSQDFPVTSIDYLNWDIIVQLFGSERKVRTALFNIREKLGDHEVLQLVDRYLGGWRPEFFYTDQSQAKETKN